MLYGVRPSISTNGLNQKDWEEIEKSTKDMVPEYRKLDRKSVSDLVKVEYEIPGCPIEEHSFLKFLIDLIAGKLPRLENAPVCLECKMNGNECYFMTKGIICLGPITQCGCNARCPTIDHKVCSGCAGTLSDANLDEWYKMILQYGKSFEEISNYFISR